MNVLRTGLLGGALLLPGVTQAQSPSPAQMGLVVATPNVVQVLDSSKNWATIGTVDPTTHLFTSTSAGGVSSFNTRTGAVTLSSGDVTGALGFTPYNNTNPANYVNAAGAASVAPVQSVATRTGAVTLTHSDITDWAATLLPYALLNSPAFTGTPSLPTGTTGITQTAGDSSTKLATTAFVGAAVTAGGYTLPIASTTVLGGVKVDGSTINISGGVISGAPSGITANSTPTSGFSAGQLMVSDGTKVQAVVPATFPNDTPANPIQFGNATYPMYMGGYVPGPGGIYRNVVLGPLNASYASAQAIGFMLEPGDYNTGITLGYRGFIGWGTTSYGVAYPNIAFVTDGTSAPSAVSLRSFGIGSSGGTLPTILRVFNTFTDTSNGEWGALDWVASTNTLTIGAQKNGTGTLRAVNLVGSAININGAAPNTNGGIGTATTTSVVVGAINTGGGSGVAPVGLADVAAGSYLKSNGVTTIPAWQAFGANVQTALGVAAGSTGSVALQSGAITTGNLVKWSGATGVSDATAVPSVNGFISTGTKPTNTTGTCPGSSGAGGATAGTFALVNICAAAGTVILTALPTATTGWACDMEDRVTRAATIVQSAATTTSATFIMGSTPSVANDVFQFKCMGY